MDNRLLQSMSEVIEKIKETCQSECKITEDQIVIPTIQDIGMAFSVINHGSKSSNEMINIMINAKAEQSNKNVIACSLDILMTGAISSANRHLEASLGRRFTMAEMEMMYKYVMSKITPSMDEIKTFVGRH